MIGRLRGSWVGQGDEGTATVECAGVGYEVTLPLGTAGCLERDEAGQVTIFVHSHWPREGEPQLFGFARLEDREAFRLLLKVETVGPKIALAVLSAMDAAELATVITRKDTARLVSISGVGRKTAERILLVLQDRVSQLPTSSAPAPKARPVARPIAKFDQVRSALGNMGFRPTEVDRAMEAIAGEGADVTDLPELIRRALQHLHG